MTDLALALTPLFQRHRIVFWYDAQKELRAEFDALTLPEVTKLELANNEFAVKHRLLREEPHGKFLLYHAGPQPDPLHNWLLDILLAEDEFHADQVSLWMNDLRIPSKLKEVVEQHLEFFQAEARRNALAARLKGTPDADTLRMNMLAVCVNADLESRLENIIEMLFDELAEDRDDRINLITRCHLADFLWARVRRVYSYAPATPTVRDFCLALFQAAYAHALAEPAPLTAESLVFLRRWKDSRRFQDAFETLSEASANLLNIEEDLYPRDYRTLIELDFFELVDRKILSALVQHVTRRTLSAGECANLIWRRRTTHWFGAFHHLYETIDHAAQFLAELDTVNLAIHSLADGIQKYTQTWYRLDQRYRKSIYHARASKQVSLLQELMDLVENRYTTHFLLKVNHRWQEVLDPAPLWDATPILPQREFFERFVGEFLRTRKKVVVLISDALRYEVGQELLERIQSENRYTADLTPLLASLPSYTQLGMAALLPHRTLTLEPTGTVTADGQSTQGTENRAKILRQAIPEGATALRADALMSMTQDESRTLFRENQVLYVYHNQIDAVGDKRETEERTFDAVEQTLTELVDLVKKLANANVTNLLITADHGFLYQHRALDESDFSGLDVAGDEILSRDRRFVLGRGLHPNPGIKTFSLAALGLTGNLEVAIPKGINRLRLKGAGSRYVHGGASLQEVVIPVLRINKKRGDDLGQVEVEILRGTSSVITTGQITIAFYQTEPVSAKVHPRTLRAGLYTQQNVPISDTHDLRFDLSSENPRAREVSVRFVLSSKANQANEQEVILKLEELIPDTNRYREYKSVRYLLRRSFTSDFDF